MALSGGYTPWLMWCALASEAVPLPAIHIVQVDRRIGGSPAVLDLVHLGINRSRQILWVIAGSEKVNMLRKFVDGDQSIPAGRIRRRGACVLADRSTAEQLIGQGDLT